jgi:hypothetical protein
LAKNPAQRYADAGALASALAECLEDESVVRALEVPIPPEESDAKRPALDARHETASLGRQPERERESERESELSTSPTMMHTHGRTPDTLVVHRRRDRMPIAIALFAVSVLAVAVALGYASAGSVPAAGRKTSFARGVPGLDPAPIERTEARPEIATEVERSPDEPPIEPPSTRPSMRLISSTRPAMTEHDVRYGTNRAPIVD